MKIYSADVRNLGEEQIKQMIADFTESGWELNGGFFLEENNFHKFIQFVWAKDSDPVAPKGYRID